MKKIISLILSVCVCAAANIPRSASAFEPVPHFTSTFVQHYYCGILDTEYWEQTFRNAKKLGFDTLIIPSVLCINREFVNTFWDKPIGLDCYSWFPLETPVDYDVSCSGDSIRPALEAAKTTDMKVWLGTVSDNSMLFSTGDYVSSYESWSDKNSKLSSSVISEIWSRYGEEYGDQIAGWYYSNDFYNFENACNGTDGGEIALIISNNINANISAIEENCPDKPIMLNPYYYYEDSTSEQFGTFLTELIASSELRPIDIYTAKDMSGLAGDVTVKCNWIEAQKAAVGDRMHFWVENVSGFFGDSITNLEKLHESYNATYNLGEASIITYINLFSGNWIEADDYFSDFMSGIIKGDVNDDGEFNVADLLLFQKWLLGVPDAELVNWKAADFSKDEYLDSFDLCFMKKRLVEKEKIEAIYYDSEEEQGIIVQNTEELYNAVENAKAGDLIKVESGEYDLSGKTLKASADGTEEQHIIIKALDSENPPVFKGETTENGYVMHITGDYWNVEGIVFTNAQKGIVLDNSNHSLISGCEIHTVGAEAIAVRDGSSYCTIEKCNIHDTGLVSPGYGEGVYIGSSKDKTEFDFKCDHNKVIDCTFKNVAAEHIDIKEYTTDTEIIGCTFYGDGMTGENYAGSFIDIKGNNCYVHDNTGYRDGNPKIVAAFEIHEQVQGWGYHQVFENNILYMDQPYGAENTNRRMYVVDGWFSDFTVKSNQVDYGEGLVPADKKYHYNCDNVSIIQEPLTF
jgi:hypothetical protein